MTRVVFGRTEAEVRGKLDRASRDQLPGAILAGTPEEIVGRLGELSEAGVERVMCSGSS